MNSSKDDIKGILIDNILIKINKLRDDKKKSIKKL